MFDVDDVRLLPVYMDNRMIEFMREFPDVREITRSCYIRAHEAGLMATPPDAKFGHGTPWPSGPVMTQLGGLIKDLVDARSQNLFSLGDILEPWGAVYVATHGQAPTFVFARYCKLFNLDPRAEAVAEWCRLNVEPRYQVSLIHRDVLSWLLRPKEDLLTLLGGAFDARVKLNSVLRRAAQALEEATWNRDHPDEEWIPF